MCQFDAVHCQPLRAVGV